MPAYFQPLALAALRLVAAFMLWQLSARRLFGMLGGEPAAIFSASWFVGLIEFVGSLALGLGFLTVPVAAVLTLELLLLYVAFYLPQGFPPYGERLGEHVVALALSTGLLAFTGPGRFSVDADLAREHPELMRRWFGERLRAYSPRALGVFRILMALLFIQHGLPKVGIGGEAAGFLTERWVAGVVETFGGLATALGALTRPAAFLASGQMAFAYFLSHGPRGFFPLENGGGRAVLFCFFFLTLAAAGAGRWSVDGWFAGRATPAGKARAPAPV